jgi:hypothetical protein
VHRPTIALVAGLSLALLAACSASTSTSGGPTVSASPTASVSASTPTISASELPTGVPTTLDPCQLVTSQEASQLSGASYGAGVEGTTSGNGKTCVYGAQTLNVFNVIVGQAADVATAQAGKAAAEAALQQQANNAIQFTTLPTFADGAAYVSESVTVSGQTYNIAAFYALKGTVFFGFSDLALNHAAPTAAALQAQAQTMLGRLP